MGLEIAWFFKFEHFKCIVLIKILLWCAIFTWVWLQHIHPSTHPQTYIYKVIICYGTQPADCSELFLLLLISGEYSSQSKFFPT